MNRKKQLDKINNIRDLSKKANSKNDKDKEIELYLRLFKEIEKLPYVVEKDLKRQVYWEIKRLSELYYEKKDYENSLVWLNEALNNPEFLRDDKEMKCSLEQHISICLINKILIKAGKNLNIDRAMEKSLLEAEEILFSLEKKGSTKISKALEKTNNLYLDVIKGIREKNIEIIMTFKIPFPLMINPERKVSFLFDGSWSHLNFKLEKIQNSMIQSNGHVQLVDDKYGLENRTSVKIILEEYLNVDNNDVFLKRALEIINYFISKYRLLTEKYWVDEVNEKMLNDFSYEVKIGGASLKHVLSQMPNAYSISNSPQWLDDEKSEKLIESLNNSQIELWHNLYLDSKNYYSINKFKESILTLNVAFETFIETNLRPKVFEAMGEDKAKLFFGGELYEEFPLKEYVNEESFQRMISENKGKFRPNVNKILNKCNDLKIIKGISKGKVKKYIDKIRKNRNDISHGRFIESKELETTSLQAIDSFKEFVKIVENIN